MVKSKAYGVARADPAARIDPEGVTPVRLIREDQVNQLVSGGLDFPFPSGAYVRQKFEGPRIERVTEEVRRQLSRPEIAQRIRPGMRIAVGVGSRGIKCIFDVTKATVDFLKEQGAKPVIVPTMGSHGGATPEGQLEVLRGYGITPEALGVPFDASMDVVLLAETPQGVPVYFSRPALEADGIIPIGRVKAHTAFRGPVESGIYKMLAIGFGKHRGAATLHSYGFAEFARLIPEVGETILAKVPVVCGIAIVENASEDPALIEALAPGEIGRREPELLELSKKWMSRILFDEFDVLIVDEIGKNISGDGMDPNVTGRYFLPFMSGGPRIQKIAVLDLTDETHGNANGIGAADVTTQDVLDKFDFFQTYTNAITSTVLSVAKLPIVMPTKRSAVALALKTINGVSPQEARVVRIKNTLELEEIWISDALLAEAQGRSDIELIRKAELEV